jgi:hypothetical protein
MRIPQEALEAIERIADESSPNFPSTTKDLLIEAIKIRRCSGIIFADGVTGQEPELREPVGRFGRSKPISVNLCMVLHSFIARALRQVV